MIKYTAENARSRLEQLIEAGYKYFCPHCLSGLEKDSEGRLYCSNEMCLNNDRDKE